MALPLLTHVQPTGYDKRGLLCQALSRTQIRLTREEKRSRARQPRAKFAIPVLDELGGGGACRDAAGASGTSSLNMDRVWGELL